MIKIGIGSGRVFDAFKQKLQFLFKSIKYSKRSMVIPFKDKSVLLCKINCWDSAFYFRNKLLDFIVMGSDIYIENELKYKCLKLLIFNCKLSLISSKNEIESNIILTKYVNTVKKHKNYNKFDIIKLNGSLETCLSLNVFKYAVDIVDTGKSIKENNLKEIKLLKPIYSLLLINKGAKKNIIINVNRLLKFFSKYELEK
ncbi:hypothetical protein ACWNYH_00385 [Candidatus Vidania fulgoroideorum]